MTRSGGGPAFPRPHSDDEQAQEGMSLRDYFAGQALAGYCANSGLVDAPLNDIASDAYQLADIMLEERRQ